MPPREVWEEAGAGDSNTLRFIYLQKFTAGFLAHQSSYREARVSLDRQLGQAFVSL
jgi:hypothetical protein